MGEGTGRRLVKIDKARDKVHSGLLGHKEFRFYSECAGKPWKLENTEERME